MSFDTDSRIVMTLDAGGTNFRFSAIRAGKPVVDGLEIPSNGDHLERCLFNIVQGFTTVKAQCPEPPCAISFAFPGPADYPNGIIGDLGNLPAFRGGVALGPMLQERFGLPVFINNDGDLFAYGEAIGGLLPYVNGLLEKTGSPRRYKNLFGVTLGTGFGGGIVRNGELLLGDNSMAGEVWLLRNKRNPTMGAEEGACIRAVRRAFAEVTSIPLEKAPDPREIYDIATGQIPGSREAAAESFRRLGEVVGDAMGNALTLIDGLAVIGGGISVAWPLFLPALIDELNSTYTGPDGTRYRRLAQGVFNLEDPGDLEKFLKGEMREAVVPGSTTKVKYAPLPRIAVGISRLGTSEAIALGAYAFALRKLDQIG